MPKRITSTGASASLGSALRTMSHGSATAVTRRENQRSSPAAEPITVPSRNPSSVDALVYAASRQSVPFRA